MQTIRHRRDFLSAARSAKQGTAGFLLQMRNRRDDDPSVRVGFTCSKKVGNAVARNRAKRRLRALAREQLLHRAKPGHDYVLVGKPGATAERDYAALLDDLAFALGKLHR